MKKTLMVAVLLLVVVFVVVGPAQADRRHTVSSYVYRWDSYFSAQIGQARQESAQAHESQLQSDRQRYQLTSQDMRQASEEWKLAKSYDYQIKSQELRHDYDLRSQNLGNNAQLARDSVAKTGSLEQAAQYGLIVPSMTWVPKSMAPTPTPAFVQGSAPPLFAPAVTNAAPQQCGNYEEALAKFRQMYDGNFQNWFETEPRPWPNWIPLTAFDNNGKEAKLTYNPITKTFGVRIGVEWVGYNLFEDEGHLRDIMVQNGLRWPGCPKPPDISPNPAP